MDMALADDKLASMRKDGLKTIRHHQRSRRNVSDTHHHDAEKVRTKWAQDTARAMLRRDRKKAILSAQA